MPLSYIFAIAAWTSATRSLFLLVLELVRSGLILRELLTNIYFGWPPLRINIVLVLIRCIVVVGKAVGLPVNAFLEAKHAF